MDHIAEIQKVKETELGTHIQIFVPGSFLETKMERYKQGDKAYLRIKLDDNRTISAKQRKMYYSTLNDISACTGHLTDQLHDYFKMLYKLMYEDVNISMGNCTVTQARQMIDILIEFVITREIPLSNLGVERTDNIEKYLYLCLVNKKCVCCGRKAETHHVDKVGFGRDRKKIDHKGMRAMALCRKHHTECHNAGEKAFEDKHKVYGIELDEYAVRKLNL